MLYIISGPSSVGKSIIVERFIQSHGFKRIVPFTTRKKRKDENEIDGVQYYFRTKKELINLSSNFSIGYWDFLFEDYYGYLEEIPKAVSSLDPSIILATSKIGLSIKKDFPTAKTIFLDFQTNDELEWRIRTRFSSNPELILAKLDDARDQIMNKKYYDIILENNNPNMFYISLLGLIIPPTQ